MDEKALEVILVHEDGVVDHGTPLLVVGVFEGDGGSSELKGVAHTVDEALGGQLSAVVRRGDFSGREGQALLLYPRSGELSADRVMVIGLGDPARADAERYRRAAGSSVKQAVRLGAEQLTVSFPFPENGRVGPEVIIRSIAEGLILGAYVFDELKSEPAGDAKPKRVSLAEVLVEGSVPEEMEAGIRLGQVMANAENLAKRLGNLPGNIATPTCLAETARGISKKYGMKVEILGRKELEREKMGALLAVSQGSEEEPFLIVLEHRKGPSGGRPLVLVGKGLTFDSGGISIKTAAGMEEMKFDMSGGAAVLAVMAALGELELPIDVIGIVPTSENLISGRAMKPGDILRSHLGKTIEVVNTDAEGRLILADGLSWARRYDPAAIVDIATLTGAAVIALGEHASAALGNDDSLIDEIRAAGERVHERVWPLPMFDEYRDQIRSDYADIKNSGGRPAGTITGAWFLREFVGETPWVHLDVAGTAYGDGKLPYRSKGSTGVPTRLLIEWIRSRVD
ncbi:MAG: leucyl aminopeptidase [Gemmatimonadota bacterium]|jgi:leucyl aminopeptidase|nr:leucyl aminopeptidase [Gemmatimonadota bacterium]